MLSTLKRSKIAMKDDFVSTFASNEKVIINQAMLHDQQISRIEVWNESREFIFLRMDCPDLESVRSVLTHIKRTFPNAGETDWVLNNSVFSNRLIFTPFFRWYD